MWKQHLLAWRLVTEFLLGRKYWVNVISTRGAGERCECSSYIHRSREDAFRHRRAIEETVTFEWVETVSFRSRMEY